MTHRKVPLVVRRLRAILQSRDTCHAYSRAISRDRRSREISLHTHSRLSVVTRGVMTTPVVIPTIADLYSRQEVTKTS